MLHTFETRLDVDQETVALLTDNAAHCSWGLRKAWSLRYRQGFSEAQAYAALKKLDFSSEQVGSLLIAAGMRHAGLVEMKKYERGQLELAIAKRERAIRDKQKRFRRWRSDRQNFGQSETSWHPSRENLAPKNI